jgi:uncharacterized protein (TIGR03435 family)
MRSSHLRIMVLALPIVVGLTSAPVRAQPTGAVPPGSARLAFEVATIKPNMSGNIWSSMPRSSGRLIVINMTLKDLLGVAYQVRAFQISGGPGWIDSNRYDIEAKAECSPSQQQMMLMLQTLLEDRFGLAFHHDTKELPTYELTVAKGGPKLQALKAGGCIPYDPSKPTLAPGKKPSDFCGIVSMRGGTFDATNASRKPDRRRLCPGANGRTLVGAFSSSFPT